MSQSLFCLSLVKEWIAVFSLFKNDFKSDTEFCLDQELSQWFSYFRFVARLDSTRGMDGPDTGSRRRLPALNSNDAFCFSALPQTTMRMAQLWNEERCRLPKWSYKLGEYREGDSVIYICCIYSYIFVSMEIVTPYSVCEDNSVIAADV